MNVAARVATGVGAATGIAAGGFAGVKSVDITRGRPTPDVDPAYEIGMTTVLPGAALGMSSAFAFQGAKSPIRFGAGAALAGAGAAMAVAGIARAITTAGD